MAGKRTSASKKASYSRYKAESRFMKNKEAKLKRHLKKFPEDEVAQEALKNLSTKGRKAPNKRQWSASRIAQTELVSEINKKTNILKNSKDSFLNKIKTARSFKFFYTIKTRLDAKESSYSTS